MKIYLDNCSLQRPLDSKTQIGIALEAEAVLGILALFELGKIELISSEVLLFEIDRNPNQTRQEYATQALSRATAVVRLDQQVEKRAREFESSGLTFRRTALGFSGTSPSRLFLHLRQAVAQKGQSYFWCQNKGNFACRLDGGV